MSVHVIVNAEGACVLLRLFISLSIAVSQSVSQSQCQSKQRTMNNNNPNMIRSQAGEQYFIDGKRNLRCVECCRWMIVVVSLTTGRSVDSRAIQQITQGWIDTHMKARYFKLNATNCIVFLFSRLTLPLTLTHSHTPFLPSLTYTIHFRETEFTKQADCSIFCGSWNVNAKKQEGSLQDWLLPTAARADIYAVGFQEIVDLNAMNVALNSNNTQQRAQFWSDTIMDCLNTQSGFSYRKIEEKYMVGLYLVIFVKESLLGKVRDIRSSNLGVGIMGLLGNKGGVLIRFSLYDSTICFVCAHLAAHRENVAGRNSDFNNIYQRSIFEAVDNNSSSGGNTNSNNNDDFATGATATMDIGFSLTDIVMPRQGAARYFDKLVSVPQHDVVFWLGDLNYRIDDSISTEDVFRLIASDNLEVLRAKDQLNLERAGGRVFQEFLEGELHFPPTYKYQPGTDEYEQRPEKKLRAPAWCDRVLWRLANSLPLSAAAMTPSSNAKEVVTLMDYRRSGLIPSDHKPVSAFFQCAVKQVVEQQETAVFKELLNTLQKVSSDALPVVEVTGLKVNFEKVLFEIPKDAFIDIRNVGSSVAHWRLVPKLEETNVSKSWITIDKLSGLLLPGEVFRCVVVLYAMNSLLVG
jgi:inositol polyphosphate 5-phosphatase INPP5B/F